MNTERNDQDWRSRLDDLEAPLDIQGFWVRLEPQLDSRRRRRAAWWFWPSVVVLVGLLMWRLLTWGPGQGANRGSSGSGPAQLPQPEMAERSDHPSVSSDLSGPGSPTGLTSATGTRPASPGDENTELPHAARPEANSGRLDEFFSPVGESGHAGRSGGFRQETARAIPGDDPSGPGMNLAQAGNEILISPVESGMGTTRSGSADGQDVRGRAGRVKSAGPLPGLPPRAWVLIQRSHLPDLGSGATLARAPGRRPTGTFGLAASAGPGCGLRRFSTSDPELSAWLKDREARETMLESWNAGLDALWIHHSGFLLEAGLGWTRQNIRFDWSRDSMVWAWGMAEGLIRHADGSTSPWSDSTWVSYSWQRKVRHYNRLDLWSLPVGLGYIRHSGPWAFQVSGGLVVFLSQVAEGRSLSPDGQPVYWAEDTRLEGNRKVGVGYYGRFRVARAIGSGWMVFVQPEVQGVPGNRVMTGDYTLRIHQASGRFGIMKIFR